MAGNGCADGGFITLHRCLQSHWIAERAEYVAAWVDLLMLASWRDRKAVADGGGVVPVPRGSCLASERFLQARWKRWGFRSRKSVRTFLRGLESEKMISRAKVGPRDTLLTVCNYDTYQSEGADEGPREAHGRPTGGPREAQRKQGEQRNKVEQVQQPPLVGLPADAGAVSSNGAGQVKEVWAAYLEALDAYRRGKNGGRSKPPVFSDKRAALIKKQLKTYPVDDLKAAVRGVFLSPYHCGENQDGTEYLTLEIALSVNRQRNNVEKFRDLHLRGGPPQQRTPTRSHGMGGTSKLMEDARRIDAQEGW